MYCSVSIIRFQAYLLPQNSINRKSSSVLAFPSCYNPVFWNKLSPHTKHQYSTWVWEFHKLQKEIFLCPRLQNSSLYSTQSERLTVTAVASTFAELPLWGVKWRRPGVNYSLDAIPL